MDSAWIFVGTVGVSVAGWFIGLEIKRLRSMVDTLLENQKNMAVQIARLESILK